MKAKILIVEDAFIEANSLRIILKKAGYSVFPIAHSVDDALQILEHQKPEIVLLDIRLQGPLTGIDLAKSLKKMNIAFVYLSANSDKQVLDAAIATKPYGFLVKPFREKDVLVMLDVASYLHKNEQECWCRGMSFRRLSGKVPIFWKY
jgi:two-component system response regulator HydG